MMSYSTGLLKMAWNICAWFGKFILLFYPLLHPFACCSFLALFASRLLNACVFRTLARERPPSAFLEFGDVM